MIILDGKKLNKEISEELKAEIGSLGSKPKIVILRVGDDPASEIYVGMKVKFAEEIGAAAEVIKFADHVSQGEVIEKVKSLNEDSSVHGVILQLPVSPGIDSSEIINTISPEKDVDGLGSLNVYKLVQNDDSGIIPATARGVITLLQENNIEIEGQHVVIVGRSLLVGKSTALNFLNHDATVTVCHSKTKDLRDHTKKADIIVVATGQPGLLTDEMVNRGQVIVDVGISVVDGKILGDVSLDHDVKAISPVPGGVGPMTVASLFQNLLKAYKIQL